MKRSIPFLLAVASALLLFSCTKNKVVEERAVINLPFPYQAYLDDMEENDFFPTIGNDGQGFDAISHNIEYPELPDSLSRNLFADSLLQYYNINLAYNTMAYDVSTACRYLDDDDLRMEISDALDSINLSGIKNTKMKNLIRTIAAEGAKAIRQGKAPDGDDIKEVQQFFDLFNNFSIELYEAHLRYDEVDPSSILPDYQEIHSKAISDTTTFRDELLNMVLTENDFQKQCILAREFAYANYRNPASDYLQVVTVLDKLLKSDEYSPLLGELWRMWRCVLQIEILSGCSNDSAMYNLFYNQLRNKVALKYITYLATHPNDTLAFKEFVVMVLTGNIVRNSECLVGNNGLLEATDLFYTQLNSATE